MSAPPPQPRTGRATYRRRVTPDDVRQRVSLRYLVDDADRGPVPTDVVGRLLAMDDDALLVVDREHQLHVVDAAQLLASRVVPTHPRLPAEPDVGTEDEPLVRHAARVLLLDPDDHVLLGCFSPQPGGRVWTTPGGGLEPSEDHRAAALRELAEELDLQVDLGPWIWSRRATFPFRGVWIDQEERWFLARTPRFEPDTAPLDDVGMDTARWWSLDELRRTTERLAPAAFADHLTTLLADGPPDEPVDVGR